jgi:hypothetical protein
MKKRYKKYRLKRYKEQYVGKKACRRGVLLKGAALE